MARAVLDESRIHAAVRERVANHHAGIVREVQQALGDNAVVVVGMAMNPHVKRARAMLERAGVPFLDLEYGSYLRDWRRRNALKMWTGWPTFPMVFVRGMLVGGADDLQRLVDSGELQRLLG
jgi:glutaredoxin-related protein